MTFFKDQPDVQRQSKFSQYRSVQKLRELAQHPIDLSQPNQLTPERVAKYYGESNGFKLLYGTEKVNDEVIQVLKDLAEESQAINQMRKMQDGEVVNRIEGYPSENRAALHTATRDLFGQPRSASKAKEAALLAHQEMDKLNSFIAKINLEGKFKQMIMVAIGGSYLGPLANYKALQFALQPEHQVHFIANVDPDETALVLSRVDLAECLVLVVSKSGTTIETATNEEFVRERFKAAGLNPQEHFICVTCPGTPMDNPEKYLQVFHMWDWIGGRFSTTSMAGAVMLAFAFGFDVLMEFLKGAHAMDQEALNPDIHKNLPLLAALLGIWNRDFLHYPTVALIPYSQALARYPAHIQQVAMESNGKMIDREGHFVDFETSPIFWGEPGTDAQHSFFQLFHQGTSVVPISMVGFKENQGGQDIEVEGTTSQEKLLANLFAQSLALATGQRSDNPNKYFPGNRPTNILLGYRLTPFTLGVLLAFYEHMIAFEGFIWGINSFDQEGVQLGKVLANKIIHQFASRKGKAHKHESYPLGEAFLKHLDSLKS